ncbi:signal peptidase I [Treponema zioleckii]|uniref:signal peptidase I n=1 Tax=Treponema zioleckii TaxID=331680 RepID=UPI00168AED7A|nr:signal peptidase I [Treponema zioleckii]
MKISLLIGAIFLLSTSTWHYSSAKRTCLVPSGSMEKTLNYGERIVVQCSEKYKSNINYGDVLIYQNEDIYCISRCVAKENDSIEIKDNIVYLNGEKLDEKYCFFDETMKPKNNKYDSFLLNLEKTTVPKNNIFVLCDNRWNSLDSRCKGPISCECVLGKVLYVSDMNNPLKKIRIIE